MHTFQLLTRLAFCSILLLVTAAFSEAVAQASPASIPTVDLKDGAYRRNGLVMRLQAGQATRLSAPMRFDNGLTLRPDGIMVSKDGTRQLLEEGRALNMQGQIVNLRDDMKTAAAIERHDQQVTGAKPTVIITPAPNTTVAPEVLAALQRTEERLATLQQLTVLLNERAASMSGTSPESQTLDSKIQELQSKLRP
ncbi:hypothetical protein HMJ29_09630 [Hymenobacter taeanensis]|uniref:DUF6799 domain-containing protein n=1 Tax=Hymenobacter taeanensis TaxID=2735321 RepID=A0A6M6BHC3_9BACT|nr:MULTISPECIES: DUF6799 domain-containing protein [Hymenobacter]QJX47184.1 hypothetical protein HMJ29_09630 [Hymenobacter taeanensis]UOQ81099.1 hypothetical protein MUN83_20195 [Hymenobacter sp. 5414T-23]